MGKENFAFRTGIGGLDPILGSLVAGDNVVWEVDSIDEYRPFALPFVEASLADGKKLVYFRFARHEPIVELSRTDLEIHILHPEASFETFIAEIYTVIEAVGPGGCYVFDSLSELSVDWYSDRMLGNFFRLTCPYLYDFDTIAYFALIKNYHSAVAIDRIHNTAQVVLTVYRDRERVFLQPRKVQDRYSKTMYMLHVREDEVFHPVTHSAWVTELLSRVPQPWLDFTSQRAGIWPRTFQLAQEALEAVRAGKRPFQETDYYFQRLLRMAFTRDEKLGKLAGRYLDLEDLLTIRKRMIGSGLIGGKSAGMLLARAILKRTDKGWYQRLERHDSFYIGSDLFYTYVVDNGCWQALRRQRRRETLLDGAAEARERMRHGKFPPDIVEQFREMLEYFGQSPIIVRSSSLLEDNYGNAFSGKYESVFCPNQGNPGERLAAFIDAVRAVYASTMSEEALHYRAHRGLLEQDEQMALLVQRVSGGIYGNRVFPQIAGVGFSFNPYAWDPQIDPRDGMLRLVFGLGTRAVDRSDDDYTRVVSLSAPLLRPEAGFDEVRRFSQHKVDVLDMEENRHRSVPCTELFALDAPGMRVDMVASRDAELERRWREQDLPPADSRFVSFENLFKETEFIERMRILLRTLHEGYGTAVDIEFTTNFLEDGSMRINLLQCRPFQVRGEALDVVRPADLEKKQQVLHTAGPIIGPGLATRIGRLIHVRSAAYAALPQGDRYELARLIGRLTHGNEQARPETIMLIGPGRWGTTTPSLGIPVNFAEINTVRVICEIAEMSESVIPDVSLGTHFFNDLVEAEILYMAVIPERPESRHRPELLEELPDRLLELEPDAAAFAPVLRVIEAPPERGLYLYANALEQRAVLYLEP